MKLLDRYVLMEMLGPFFIGIFGFILVMITDLLFTMADLIINKGVPFFEVLKLMVYKLPSILVLTFPVSTLFATAMALGRMSKDNELIAMRTSGITLFRIARPILMVSLVVSLMAFVTNEEIVPSANRSANRIIRDIIQKKPLPEIQKDVFFSDAQGRYYYARQVDMKNKTMEDIMVYELGQEPFPRVITARHASFGGQIWDLENGVIHKYDESGYIKYEAAFSKMKLNISEDVINYSQSKSSQEMDIGELKQTIGVLKKGGVNINIMLTELYLKYSIPLTCFVFALVGIPFSLPSPRTGRTWGMVMTIVFMFTFYVFASIFRSLGRGGVLPPMAAAFTPQIFFVIVGGILLFREGYLK